MSEQTAAGEFEVAPFETVHEAELASAAVHLDASRTLSQQAHEGWTHLPTSTGHDGGHPGFTDHHDPLGP